MTKKNSPRKCAFSPAKPEVETAAGVSNPTITAAAPLRPVRQRIRPTPPTPDAKAPPSSEVRETSYTVGYRKPPAHSQFKPGKSGNPKGRKKGAKGMKALAQQTLTAKVSVRTSNGDHKMMRIEALLHKLVELGMKGNPRALLALFHMYQEAIPEIVGSDSDRPAPQLTPTDEATLAMLKDILLTQGESS
ncbi:MAG: hypothetical protein HQ446_14000 [Polaromonas sp.]|nr:hypothetical protein [Polaromonas sp.]